MDLCTLIFPHLFVRGSMLKVIWFLPQPQILCWSAIHPMVTSPYSHYTAKSAAVCITSLYCYTPRTECERGYIGVTQPVGFVIGWLVSWSVGQLAIRLFAKNGYNLWWKLIPYFLYDRKKPTLNMCHLHER